MQKTITKKQKKELKELFGKIIDITGNAFISCNVKEGENDTDGHIIGCIYGGCSEIARGIAIKLKANPDLKNVLDAYNSMSKLKKMMKDLLDDLD